MSLLPYEGNREQFARLAKEDMDDVVRSAAAEQLRYPEDRDLLAVRFLDGRYAVEVLDHDVGPANAVSFRLDGKTRVLAANRETNEVAYYTLTEN